MLGKNELVAYKASQTAKNAADVVAVLNKGVASFALGISPTLDKEIRDRARKYMRAKSAIVKWVINPTVTNAHDVVCELKKCNIKHENITRDFPGDITSEQLESLVQVACGNATFPKKMEGQTS